MFKRPHEDGDVRTCVVQWTCVVPWTCVMLCERPWTCVVVLSERPWWCYVRDPGGGFLQHSWNRDSRGCSGPAMATVGMNLLQQLIFSLVCAVDLFLAGRLSR